jgi:hypothetical protein
VATEEDHRPESYLDQEDSWLVQWEESLRRLTEVPEYRESYSKSYWFEGAGGPGGPPLELIIALSGTAGAICTALLSTFSKFLAKHESRELTIEREGKKLTLKGHNLKEERQLVEELFPEALREQIELPDK